MENKTTIINVSLHKLNLDKSLEDKYEVVDLPKEIKEKLLVDTNKMNDKDYLLLKYKEIASEIKKYLEKLLETKENVVVFVSGHIVITKAGELAASIIGVDVYYPVLRQPGNVITAFLKKSELEDRKIRFIIENNEFFEIDLV